MAVLIIVNCFIHSLGAGALHLICTLVKKFLRNDVSETEFCDPASALTSRVKSYAPSYSKATRLCRDLWTTEIPIGGPALCQHCLVHVCNLVRLGHPYQLDKVLTLQGDIDAIESALNSTRTGRSRHNQKRESRTWTLRQTWFLFSITVMMAESQTLSLIASYSHNHSTANIPLTQYLKTDLILRPQRWCISLGRSLDSTGHTTLAHSHTEKYLCNAHWLGTVLGVEADNLCWWPGRELAAIELSGLPCWHQKILSILCPMCNRHYFTHLRETMEACSPPLAPIPHIPLRITLVRYYKIHQWMRGKCLQMGEGKQTSTK